MQRFYQFNITLNENLNKSRKLKLMNPCIKKKKVDESKCLDGLVRKSTFDLDDQGLILHPFLCLYIQYRPSIKNNIWTLIPY